MASFEQSRARVRPRSSQAPNLQTSRQRRDFFGSATVSYVPSIYAAYPATKERFPRKVWSHLYPMLSDATKPIRVPTRPACDGARNISFHGSQCEAPDDPSPLDTRLL